MAQMSTTIFFLFQYSITIIENSLNQEVLRIQANDLDLEFTDNWYADYFFISGNENNNFEIILDRSTNEGIVRIVEVWISNVFQHH